MIKSERIQIILVCFYKYIVVEKSSQFKDFVFECIKQHLQDLKKKRNIRAINY